MATMPIMTEEQTSFSRDTMCWRGHLESNLETNTPADNLWGIGKFHIHLSIFYVGDIFIVSQLQVKQLLQGGVDWCWDYSLPASSREGAFDLFQRRLRVIDKMFDMHNIIPETDRKHMPCSPQKVIASYEHMKFLRTTLYSPTRDGVPN